MIHRWTGLGRLIPSSFSVDDSILGVHLLNFSIFFEPESSSTNHPVMLCQIFIDVNTIFIVESDVGQVQITMVKIAGIEGVSICSKGKLAEYRGS